MTHTPLISIMFYVQFVVKWGKCLFFRKIIPTSSFIPLGVHSSHFVQNEFLLFYHIVTLYAYICEKLVMGIEVGL